jgi:oligopeptide transport system ATP-binding protein
MTVLLEVQNLKKYFPVKGGWLKAVDGISFTLNKGETLGLVGESGCGKSTLARSILRIYEPTAGKVRVYGQDITRLSPQELRSFRCGMQIVFQDPYASLNPRLTIEKALAEPLKVHGLAQSKPEIHDRVVRLLALVGLSAAHLRRYPHEFSGGQRQRIVLARALALNPELIVCDEPVSALDVSIQAQIVNLLKELQIKLGLTYMFIAHDLNVVKHISHRVAVMYLGKIVEIAAKKDLYEQPLHPYTQALLSAVPPPHPQLKKERIILGGDVPNPLHPPSGCRFHTRCPQVFKRCFKEEPALLKASPSHWVACHLTQ